MKRIKDSYGTVHFYSTQTYPICAEVERNMLGELVPMTTTKEPVTCRRCAETYCRIKNAPWNEVDSAVLDEAMYDAVGRGDKEFAAGAAGPGGEPEPSTVGSNAPSGHSR